MEIQSPEATTPILRSTDPRSQAGAGASDPQPRWQGSRAPADMTNNGMVTEPPCPCPRTEQAMQFIADSISRGSNSIMETTETVTNQEGGAHPSTSQIQDHAAEMPKKRNRKKGTKGVQEDKQPKYKNESNLVGEQQTTNNDDTKKNTKKKKKNRKSRKKNSSAAPWREFIPPDLDDPISLEPLNKLPYPPFAIVVEPPYIPIWPGMWPPLPTTTSTTSSSSSVEDGNGKQAEYEEEVCSSKHDEKERQISILKEQWGEDKISAVTSKIIDSQGESKNSKPPPPTSAPSNLKTGENISTTNDEGSDSIQGRHVNLFDGRVLAYYLVSTLQFIDPYNRRDLTRPELEALDAYLAFHKLGQASIVEAYDDKGVTISTAGRAAQSATGRAEILQQEARAILGSFFQQTGGSGGVLQRDRQRDDRRVSSLGNVRENDFQGASRFQRLYAAQQGGTNRNNDPQSAERQEPEIRDTGIYEGVGGGLLVIDDDINPGLRGGIPDSGNLHDTWQGRRHSPLYIAERYGHEAQVREEAFPSLTSANAAAPTAASGDENSNGISTIPTSVPSKSLSKIANLVQKTDPKQVERQRKAREEALRRAELSKLSFFNPENTSTSLVTDKMSSASPIANMSPSEALLERNRKLAIALGVEPSTVRNEPTLTGWSRPVAMGAFESELEENLVQYPDALLAKAKERMVELLKLEKKWNQCLLDDRAISCSLKPMDRPTRKFVHEYSDHWGWRTMSFDPEGQRYIHCAKTNETRVPNPLLSEAARKWRGPTVGPSSRNIDVTMLPRGPAPKTEAISSSAPTAAKSEVGSASSLLSSVTGELQPPPRSASLLDKERPKLQLAPRSIPTWEQLEKLHISQQGWNDMTPGQQDQVMREIEQDNAKKAAQIQREKYKQDARAKKLESKAKQKQDAMKKKQALLESAFVSSDEENGADSDWSEDEVVFNGSDDEAM